MNAFIIRPQLWSIHALIIFGNLVLLVEKAWTLKIFFISITISTFVFFLQKKKIEFQHKEQKEENRKETREPEG